MRLRMLTPAVAILALAACGEDNQTAQRTTTADAPAVTAPTTATPPPATAAAPTPGSPTTTAEAPPTAAPPASVGAPASVPPATTATNTAPISGDTGGTVAAAPPVTPPGGPGETTGALTTPAATDPIRAGTYQGERGVRLDLRNGGQFALTRSEGGQQVEGSYRIENGVLILAEGRGDTGGVQFPMRCRVERTDDGFRLVADGQSCQPLENMMFRPAT